MNVNNLVTELSAMQSRIAVLLGDVLMDGVVDNSEVGTSANNPPPYDNGGNSQSPPPKAQGFKVPRSFVETSELAGEPQPFYVREGTALLEGQRMCMINDKSCGGTLRLIYAEPSSRHDGFNNWVVDMDEGGYLPASVFEPVFDSDELQVPAHTFQDAFSAIHGINSIAISEQASVLNVTNGEGRHGDRVQSLSFPDFNGILVHSGLGPDGSKWLVDWDNFRLAKAHVYDLALIKGGDHE